MLALRRDSERGRSESGWLSSRHAFSFADYFDPAQMGFRALTVHRDVAVFGTRLAAGKMIAHALEPERRAWVRVVDGDLDVNGVRLGAGDGAALSDEPTLAFEARARSELLVFDLA